MKKLTFVVPTLFAASLSLATISTANASERCYEDALRQQIAQLRTECDASDGQDKVRCNQLRHYETRLAQYLRAPQHRAPHYQCGVEQTTQGTVELAASENVRAVAPAATAPTESERERIERERADDAAREQAELERMAREDAAYQQAERERGDSEYADTERFAREQEQRKVRDQEYADAERFAREQAQRERTEAQQPQPAPAPSRVHREVVPRRPARRIIVHPRRPAPRPRRAGLRVRIHPVLPFSVRVRL